MIEVIATYRPPWRDSAGRAVAGHDEDATTMAVAVASRVPADRVGRVVVVTRAPALLEGPTEAVIATALGLQSRVHVELHLGGGPAVLDVVTTAAAGTLVIGVDPGAPAAAGAAFISVSGARVMLGERTQGRLPARVRAPGEEARVCDDPRLVRDLGWRAALGDDLRMAEAARSQGASAPLLALAEMADRGADGVVVALETGTMTLVEVTDVHSVAVFRDEATPHEAPTNRPSVPTGSPIPASAAAFARAFDAKVGFAGGRCECGALDLPPRYLCLNCRKEAAFTMERLPRVGSVYSVVTIHAPVPRQPRPYSLAIIDIDEVGVRYLAPVTGVPAGTVAIGDRGRLVLRRLADREVGPDYGWAFEPVPA